MAISPPALPLLGKESTSVGLFFLRKRRFNSCRRRLPAISISTSPKTPAIFCAFLAKRASPTRLTPSSSVSKMITFSQKQIGRARNRPPCEILLFSLLQRRFLAFFSAGLLRQLQRHLLIARSVVISPHDALHQVMAHHVLLGKEVEGEPFHILENIHGLQQPAAPRIRQVDLGDVAGDHGL